jgi:hypothetical protein
MCLRVDPARDEALQLAPIAIQDPQRRITRARDLTGRLEHLIEHGLRIELRQQAPADLDQAAQPLLVEVIFHWGPGRSSLRPRPFFQPAGNPGHFVRAGTGAGATPRRRVAW